MSVARPHSPGVIDSTLDYLVTSFQLSQHAMEELPEWLRKQLPKVKTNLGIKSSFPEEDDGQPTYFIGKLNKQAECVSAPRLDTQLAEQGFIPSSIRIYIKQVRATGILYRMNIRWNKQQGKRDAQEQYEQTRQFQDFFRDLQRQFAWNVKGLEFKKKTERSIVLDFTNGARIPPSLRRSEIALSENAICLL